MLMRFLSTTNMLTTPSTPWSIPSLATDGQVVFLMEKGIQ